MAQALELRLFRLPASLDEVDGQLRALAVFRAVDPTAAARMDVLLDQRLRLMAARGELPVQRVLSS